MLHKISFKSDEFRVSILLKLFFGKTTWNVKVINCPTVANHRQWSVVNQGSRLNPCSSRASSRAPPLYQFKRNWHKSQPNMIIQRIQHQGPHPSALLSFVIMWLSTYLLQHNLLSYDLVVISMLIVWSINASKGQLTPECNPGGPRVKIITN